MSAFTRWMDSRLYPNYCDNWDNKRLRQYIMERLQNDDSMLDPGAGRGALMEMNFKGVVKFVAGVDPDPAVHENPYLDEAKTWYYRRERFPTLMKALIEVGNAMTPSQRFIDVIHRKKLENLRQIAVLR